MAADRGAPPYHRAVTDPRPSPAAGPAVCPFVALAEDRDRRADAPDEGNRCYAERAPRRRDLVYQSEYCYSAEFARCSAFLGWAARNAAEPAFVSEAARRAWRSGVAAPEQAPGAAGPHPTGVTEVGGAAAGAGTAAPDSELLPPPTPEGGLFGPPDPAQPDQVRVSEQLDWVSASAWAEVPWDERAEQEAAEIEALESEEELELEPAEAPEPVEEATRAPRVPAALPMRRRKPPSEPIRSRGSGEWFYADPPGREPLVSRRTGIAPTVMLAVLGLLVVSVVVMLVASQIGGDGTRTAAASPTPLASVGPAATRAPLATAQPSLEPSPTPPPKREFYRVKEGDTLTGIAAKLGVRWQHLQCLNGLVDKNLVVVGARYEIPPEGFECPKGWRNAVEGP